MVTRRGWSLVYDHVCSPFVRACVYLTLLLKTSPLSPTPDATLPKTKPLTWVYKVKEISLHPSTVPKAP